MTKYTGSITVNIDVNTCYDLVLQYFTSIGFSLRNGVKPNNLIFERGSNWTADVGIGTEGFEKEWRTKKIRVEVNITSSTSGTLITCTYGISALMLDMFGKDRTRVDKDIMELKNCINNATKIVPSTTTPIAKQREVIIKEIVKIPCKYCGTLVEITENKCPSCGGNLK